MNQPDGETFDPEAEPHVLWPTRAIEAAEAERARLADVIARARASLPSEQDLRPLGRFLQDRATYYELLDFGPILGSILETRAILAEATPEGPSGEGGYA